MRILGILAWAMLINGYSCSHIDVQKLPDNANPTEEITKLEADRARAVQEQVDVMSPTYYQRAVKALHAAEDTRDSGKDNEVVLNFVAEGRAYLNQAKETAKISKTTLSDVFTARSDAIAANAPKNLEPEFTAIDKSLMAATTAIEKQNLGAAEKSRSDLRNRYLDIELKSIVQEKLDPAKKTLAQAVKEGAEKNAKRTYDEAYKSIADAEAFVSANRHDKVAIQSKADAALASANRLLDINRKVKVAGKEDDEAHILALEAREKAAADALAAKSATAAQLEAERAKLAEENATARGLRSELQTQQNMQEQQAQFNRRLDAAKEQFTPEEADVYRDGNQLVVRLKSLAFPSGKAVLRPQNFAVLGKVQKTIHDLNADHVIVEGHTDSVGKKAANQKLSLERAEAIRKYLSANGAIDASKITAVGYGDAKPIAPNNTKEGRAQNRRVDIIIEPAVLVH